MILCLAGCRSVKVAEADGAFASGEYFAAQKAYRQIYNKLTQAKDRPLRGRIAFNMGECYLKLNQSAKAASAFQNAIRYSYPDSTAYLFLGRALQAEGKYQQAMDAYTSFLDYDSGNRLAEEGIRGCRIALASKNMPASRYSVSRVNAFETRRSEFSPMFPPDATDRLYFTSTSEKAIGDYRSTVTGTKMSDIFMSRQDENGNWLRPEPAQGEVNSHDDEGIISFSPDGQKMYLTRTSHKSSTPQLHTSSHPINIWVSQRSDATWSEPSPLDILRDTVSVAGHPAISPDGQWLYFCSDMPGGFGGLDIWKIRLDEGGVPVNLGPQINTEGNEMFPYLRNDSTLYFSSDTHPGFGGLDIFRATQRLEPTGSTGSNLSGTFWNVENMGLPINSRSDDFGITFGDGESGFFSSSRGDARGYDHIYSFVRPEINVSISGVVTDKDEEPVAGAIIRIVGDDGSNLREVARDDGSFRFPLQRGVKYVMKAGAPGYLNVKQEFESAPDEEDAEYVVDFVLMAINKPQVVENIFFDFDKATLRPESKEALDGLVTILEENPNITIELSAHTDRKGSDEYNLALSERRSRSVTDYLENAGISADRLFPKGYGETQPKTVTKKINRQYPQFPEGTVLTEEYIETLSPEDRDAADQINRRTEFRVLSTDYDLL